MLNRVDLQGRMTGDPELRYTQKQTPVTAFRIAVERDVKDKDGQRQADFIDVVAWRQTAEFVSRWFHKGDMCVVSGRLQVRAYTDKNDNRRQAVEVVADNVYFCANSHGNSEAQIPKAADGPELRELDDDGDLPF